MENNVANTRVGVTGFTLKLVACFIMLIDHVGYAIIKPMAVYKGYQVDIMAFDNKWSILYTIMRLVGRIAFPLFVFLLVEGYLHTSDRKSYIWRVFVFALISEIPFNMMVTYNRKPIYFKHNGTLWTLLMCLILLCIFDRLEQQLDGTNFRRYQVLFEEVAIALVFMLISYGLRLDHKVVGIGAAAAMYMCRSNKVAAYALGVAMMGIVKSNEFVALLAVPLIVAYRGSRGISRKSGKYFFYIFYPAHLVLVSLAGYFVTRLYR